MKFRQIWSHWIDDPNETLSRRTFVRSKWLAGVVINFWPKPQRPSRPNNHTQKEKLSVFFKWALPGLLTLYFCSFQTNNFGNNEGNMKNVHPVSCAGIWTHELGQMSVACKLWVNVQRLADVAIKFWPRRQRQCPVLVSALTLQSYIKGKMSVAYLLWVNVINKFKCW